MTESKLQYLLHMVGNESENKGLTIDCKKKTLRLSAKEVDMYYE